MCQRRLTGCTGGHDSGSGFFSPLLNPRPYLTQRAKWVMNRELFQ